MPSNTAGRSRPASRRPTASASSSTRTWGWCPRSSTSARWPPCADTSRSATADTRRPVGARGRTPSRPSAGTRPARSPWPTTATSPTPRSCGTSSMAASATRRTAGSWLAATRRTPLSSRRSSRTTPTEPSRRPRSTCCRGCGGRSASSSSTSTRCMPPATPTASAPWSSAGSSVAGSSRRETAALDIVGASLRAGGRAGELVVIDEDGLRSQRFAAPTPKGCVFEYVYLARPDTTISGRVVHEARVEMGRALAREHPVDADLVMPTPESGTPAAIGYAQESGIPYGQGLVKNSYVGRTFIAPSQTIRQLGIRLKLNPLQGRHPRQAPRGRRRLDRPRQHPACARADAAGGRGCRGPCADLVPAGAAGRASTASTSRPAPSSSRPDWGSRRCAARSVRTRWATSPTTG